MAALLLLAQIMFPEGHGRPRAAPRGRTKASYINELLVNSKKAIDSLWKQRGYDPKKPAETKRRLGYAPDKEEAIGYILTAALGKPLLSAREARTIGKRVVANVTTGSVGTKLSELKKRGASTVLFLAQEATVSLAPPPPEKPVAAAPTSQPPSVPPSSSPLLPSSPQPPLPPQPAPPPPPAQLPPPSEPADIDRHAAYLNALCVKARFEVAEATRAAEAYEMVQTERESPGHWNLDDDECTFRELDFKVALMKLKRKVPQLDFRPDDVISGAYSAPTFVCRCGEGRLPVFPWVPLDEDHCYCEDASEDHCAWRMKVMEAGHAFYTVPVPRPEPLPRPTGRVVVSRPEQCEVW